MKSKRELPSSEARDKPDQPGPLPPAALAWGALRLEARQALEQGPPIASIHHDAMADAHWAYLASIGSRAKAVAAELGLDPERRFKHGKGEFQWAFAIEDHRAIEARYQAGAAALATRGLFLAPWQSPTVFAAAGFAMPGWLVKLLSLFGIEAEDLEVVGEAFSEEFGDDLLDDIKRLFGDAFEDAADGQWKAAEEKLAEAVKKLERFLEELLDRLDDFVRKLAIKWFNRIGGARAVRKAEAVAAKIASKVLPGVGWLLFVLELLWLLMKNIGIFYV